MDMIGYGLVKDIIILLYWFTGPWLPWGEIYTLSVVPYRVIVVPERVSTTRRFSQGLPSAYTINNVWWELIRGLQDFF